MTYAIERFYRVKSKNACPVALFPPSLGRTPAERAYDKQQNDRADDRADGTSKIETGNANVTEQSVQPTTEQCPDDADDDVTQETAGSLTWNDPFGDEADD
jgi:hypothetical protein